MKKPAPELTMLKQLLSIEDNRLTLDERVTQLQVLRTMGDAGSQIDRALVERILGCQQGLAQAAEMQRRLKKTLDQLTATPWFPATFIQTCPTPEGPRYMVQMGNTRRVVGRAPSMDGVRLYVGNEVYLNNELNVIVAKAANIAPRTGETAVFERRTTDGRLVLRHHDEEIVMDAAESLRETVLSAGDLVRCDRAAWIAYEKIERSKGEQLFLEETPSVTFEEIGGLDRVIGRIERTLNLHVLHGETAARYGLRRKGAILFDGPSGTGKTMLAKATANWLAKRSPSGRARFMNIKPSELHSMWYGQSEANYREAFRVAREAGDADPQVPVVMFFDEIDSIGMARGHAQGHVDDRVLTAFMAELDGLKGRGNIVVIGATNRRTALDAALLRPGRLGDLVLVIPRPKRKAALDILSKHLGVHVPLARNGHGDDMVRARQDILETTVSLIFAPNADNELATLQFRDGKRRAVRAADLVSGALIANIANCAVERACVREVETGEPGLRIEDLTHSLEEEFDAAVRSLTPANCRQHLLDLPQDMDVVSILPTSRKARAVTRYLN